MHTTAGPLQPSSAMLELLRLSRARGASFTDATLDVAVVHRIETELRATLPDDVLVVLATRDPDLACATGLSVDTILDFAEDCEAGLGHDYVAIARVYEAPFAARATAGERGGGLEVLAVRRPGNSAGQGVLVVEASVARGRRPRDMPIGPPDPDDETSLAVLARERMTAWFREQDAGAWFEALRREATLPLVDPSWSPALVGSLFDGLAGPRRVVVHPKFGRGAVVEERVDGGDPKLVIDFEAAGRKTLLARFVRDASEV